MNIYIYIHIYIYICMHNQLEKWYHKQVAMSQEVLFSDNWKYKNVYIWLNKVFYDKQISS